MRWLITLAVVLGSAACTKDVTADMEKFADRACECKDVACGRAVLDEVVTFANANKSGHGDQTRLEAAGQRLGQCVIAAGVPAEEAIAKARAM